MTDSSKYAGATDDFATFEDGSYAYSKQGPRKKPSTAAGPLHDVLETLYSEHRYISSLLDTLEEQADRLLPGKVPDYHLLLDIIDYLTHYPDQYHHPREDLLFTGMLQSDGGFQDKLARLEREHETLHHYNHQLFNELTRIAAGRPVGRPVLLQNIKRYIAGYRQHMDYENSEIFPRAKGTLSAESLKKLGTRTRYIDDPLFGGEVLQRYQRVGRSLQSRVEIASHELIAREMSGIESTIEKLSGLVDTLENLNTAISRQRRQAWREQFDTIKTHARFGETPNITLLPVALIRNHRRHLADGIAEIREILSNDTHAKRTPESGPDSGGRPGRSPRGR